MSLMAEDLIGLCHTLTYISHIKVKYRGSESPQLNIFFVLSVIALIPPMQIHVFESTSSKRVARQMGQHNLGLCMLAMGELAKCYISAIAAYKLFDTAIQKVDKARGSESEQQSSEAGPPPPRAAASSEGTLSQTSGTEPQSQTWENWPEGYSTSTAGVVADVWLPWTNGVGIQ
jgi:hypothetical protein